MIRSAQVGIVGGGPAGALCARLLAQAGVEVVVLDKGRRPGGRLSTRHYDTAHFDHGAQYMTLRDPTILALREDWGDSLAPWTGEESDLGANRPFTRRDQRWVGKPSMSAFVAHLLDGTICHFESRVTDLSPGKEGFELLVEGQAPCHFERVVVAIPAPQARALLGSWPELQRTLDSVVYAPCWAAMAEFEGEFPGAWTSAKPKCDVVAWVARNQTKPGRPAREAWVIHATPRWSREHLEDPREEVAQVLVENALERAQWSSKPSLVRGHRWRYALVEQPVGQPCLYEEGLGVCGDSLLGGRVESALLSGHAMAERILASL